MYDSNNITFKKFNAHYTNEIYQFIKHNIELANDNMYGEYFSREFFLSKLNKKNILSIGCFYRKIILACVCIYTDVVENSCTIFINCVHQKLSNTDLGSFFVKLISNFLKSYGFDLVLVKNKLAVNPVFKTDHNYIIPINIQKLIAINFLPEDHEIDIRFNNVENNLLRYTNKIDAKYIQSNHYPKIHYMDFTSEKLVTYSMVNKLENNVTDYIQLDYSYMYCYESGKVLKILHVIRYFSEIIGFDNMIIFCVNRLMKYGIDQIIIPKQFVPEITTISLYETDPTYYILI